MLSRRGRRIRAGCTCSAIATASNAGPSTTSDRKSTRLNSSHVKISYAVFCLKNTTTHDNYTLSLHDALPIYETNMRNQLLLVNTMTGESRVLTPEVVDGPA